MYARGSAQSHRLTTTLRSTPSGRGGAVGGYSPASMRSVQSAYIASAGRRPTWFSRVSMFTPAWPDLMRRSQAATCESKSPKESGISRVALLPSAWQPVQPSVLTTPLIQAPWLAMPGEMPLPCEPVPGNSSGAGSWSRENQYCAG